MKIKLRLPILKKFLENSSIHGFKYIVKMNYHWMERGIWLFICCLSWYGCLQTIRSLFDNFINHPIAITAETSYLNWKTPFPSLVFCTSFSKEADEFAIKLINSRGKNGRRFRRRLMLEPTAGYVPELDGLLSAEDLISIYSKAKLKCSDIFSECSWNRETFNCCDEFGMLQSPVGFCYMLNSVHAQRSKSSEKFVVNRTSKQAHLSVNFTKQFYNWHRNPDVKVYFLNNYEIPTVTSSDKKDIKKLSAITGIDFTIEDIINDEGVKSLSPNKRACRFADENHQESIYKYYSYEGCSIDLTIKHMLNMCGCVSFRYPRKSNMPVCNMTEMHCILKLKEKSGLTEHECLPDCDGSLIHAEPWTSPIGQPEFGGLRIKLLSPPFVRFRRYIVHSTLDVIGSIN